jgi:hypothetical protein
VTPPLPLDQIRLFDWKSHRAALWWFGVTYAQPKTLSESLGSLSRARATKVGIVLYLHSLLYVAVLSVVLTFTSLSGVSKGHWLILCSITTAEIALTIVSSVAVAISFEVAGRIERMVPGVLAFGTVWAMGTMIAIVIVRVGIHFGMFSGVAPWVAVGLALGTAIAIDSGIPLGITHEVGIAASFGVSLGSLIFLAGYPTGYPTGAIAGGMALSISCLRGYNYLAHPFFLWPRVRGDLYRLHPVAWDDHCTLPFPWLYLLLVEFVEIYPEAGQAEIERLITRYPIQRPQAIRARIAALARQSKRLADLSNLADIAAQMPQGAVVWLDQSRHVSEGLTEISLIATRLNTASRPMLREPLAEMLIKEIENFRHRIAGFKEPLASEFRAAATVWAETAQGQLDQARSVLRRKPFEQIFRAGDPVNREGEAFVYRDVVVGRLDQQVSLATGCPGIVLYGRRRMGKSTLLMNLDGFLPPTVTACVISMQDPTAFTSLQHFTEKISEGREHNLPGLSRYLNSRNEELKSQGKRLLLALDEYENIDTKIGEGVFPKDLLAAIRESIQQHRHIIWLFAGSHEITELDHAEWTSYLVSARTIEVPPFSLDETRLLLTDPLKESPLFRKVGQRPRFAPELWGAGGIERIHAEASGWPHLVQLIAETLVDLLNNDGAPQVTPELMERALDEAVVSGQNVLYQLMRGESLLPGEWEYLSTFRYTNEQAPSSDEAIRRSLLRRQVIRETAGRWRLRVPLMGRWLRLRG